ncbi:11365_t:CDS:2, partial [Entrophospora sp. SA101]
MGGFLELDLFSLSNPADVTELKKIEALVIEEVSMVDGDFFTFVSNTFAKIHKNNLIFEGIPTLVIGPSSIPSTKAVPNDAKHNPLVIDCDSLIFRIENHYMSLLSQSYNNRFANQLILSEDDLFGKLKSTQSYIEAMK